MADRQDVVSRRSRFSVWADRKQEQLGKCGASIDRELKWVYVVLFVARASG
jgi:hypothetical protein